ncbi:DEAD/DEAH box helicase [Achromobacter mucicolens]|uniref:ATP-dependent DNA helicase n=1 Tax=Achromobacter mucicolens TaxID=1389922 RepID=UPI002452B345|nr:DEAD/DEAH box helicase [Achromobacter mucicolens]WGJ91271.1 DEAD/DEAH box helicase [Achromobacter mucicolens]
MTNMKIQLTQEQSAALQAIQSFVLDDKQDAFILRGSAGTGKTTLIAKLVDTLDSMNLSYGLLAPTGRAARILGNKIKQIAPTAHCEGTTIHSAIYTLDHMEVNEGAETANDPGLRMFFPLKEEESMLSLFVIDESSMVGDKETLGDVMRFGTGRLLKDVITYGRMRRPGRTDDHITKLLFVGDPAQLPPVGENSSPALDDDYLRSEHKLQVSSFDLKNVMRQAQGSAILDRATELRDALLAKSFNTFSLQPNQQDIEQVESQKAIDLVVEGLQQKDSNVVVVHSNATALEYNRNIRERRWGNPGLPIQAGDTLLVNKNSTTHALSNGDLVKVIEAAPDSKHVLVHLKGGYEVELWFRNVTVAFRDSSGRIIQTPCKVLENLLTSPHRELSALEQRALLVDFRKRHPDLHPKSAEFRKTIRRDPYFNALQVKYGYAMTCHKAQGGEWSTVIVDFEANVGTRNASFFRWSYTAITRAARKLIIVNPPDFTPVSGIDWQGASGSSATSAQPDMQGLVADPDWLRLSFSAATAPLMPIHQKLRTVWDAQGIAVERLQHLQYCERYTVLRNGQRASVQYHYNGKFQVGKSSVVPGAVSDSTLADEALTSINALANKPGTELANQFIQDFINRLDAALESSEIQRTGHKAMPYRLRVSFADATRLGEIDFTYDGSSTWTSAQEVGGPGSTHGIYDEVQCLMANYKRGER